MNSGVLQGSSGSSRNRNDLCNESKVKAYYSVVYPFSPHSFMTRMEAMKRVARVRFGRDMTQFFPSLALYKAGHGRIFGAVQSVIQGRASDSFRKKCPCPSPSPSLAMSLRLTFS